MKWWVDDEGICSLSHSKPSSLMPDLVFPAVCLLIQSLVNVTQGDEYCDMFSLCLEYHMSLEGFWGWNYRFQTRALAHTHTHTQIHTPHPSFWCKMPAPLNRRRNPPRFSGLPLSILLPAEEAGDIYHKPRDDVTRVRTAVGVKVMSRMGAESPKSLLLWHLIKTKWSEFPVLSSLLHCHVPSWYHWRKASVGVPEQQTILMFRGVPTANLHKS